MIARVALATCLAATAGLALASHAQDSGGAGDQDADSTTPGQQEMPPADDGSVDDAGDARSLRDDDVLLGDWGGPRTSLAESGLSFDLQWTQSVQGVVHGGRDKGWKYGGSLDLLTSVDLGSMDVVPGGFVRALLQGRYGESVIREAGTILPVNTDLFFPLTGELDDEILSVTELSYTQFFSDHFAVLGGKLQTLDGDPNEFASGRGRSQFMNFNLVSPNLIGNAVPYSTLGVGVLILPTPKIAISSLVMNTSDSSTTSGFDDVGDGTTWVTEAQFQYRLGELPGGMNVGFAYAFDNEFLNFNRSGLDGDGIRVEDEEETWSAYWSGWQYLVTLDEPPAVIAQGNGRPDVRGFGLFARAGLVDEDTNVVSWSASVGLGGRGIIPSRDDDTFGIGFAYTDFNDDRRLTQLLAEEQAYGLEAYYNAALAPGVSLTGDIQFIEPAGRGVSSTVVVGARLNLRF